VGRKELGLALLLRWLRVGYDSRSGFTIGIRCHDKGVRVDSR